MLLKGTETLLVGHHWLLPGAPWPGGAPGPGMRLHTNPCFVIY